MQRSVVPAVAAFIVLGCAIVGVWIGLVHSVDIAVISQARLGSDLLDAHAPIGPALASTLRRPGLHVLIADPRSGTIVEADSAGTTVHGRPTLGAGRDPAFALGPPPLGAEEPPGRPPPDGPAPMAPLAVVEHAALSLAHVAPIRMARDDGMIEIAPDPRELGRWLTLETLCFIVGSLLIVGNASLRTMSAARRKRRALEARVAERRAAAERYQRLLAETGHELRTPLTVMTGYIDLLRARGSAAPIDERMIEGMHSEATRMRVLVEKMMLLARLESDAAVPRLVDVATAAREAAQTLQRRYPDSDVRLEPQQTASIVIDADDYAAALGNVLENAVKYAPGSPILIQTSVRDGQTTTSVIDRGPGIDVDERQAIFERFYRGRERAAGEGLGLGLAIVKRIADRWNGTIGCESGDGTTIFRLTFPLADEELHGVAR